MDLEIGVIKKRNEPAFPAPWTVLASDQFASRIARRYAASELTVSRAELALAHQSLGEVDYFKNVHVNVAPQVHVHEHLSFRAAPREIATGSRGAPPASVEKFYERVFSRQERVTLFAAAGETTGAHREEIRPLAGFSAMHPEPVERTVRAALAEERTARPDSPHVSDSDSGWGTPITPPASPKPLTLPAAEVKRVAEQVIREIDHRITARRERMGRR